MPLYKKFGKYGLVCLALLFLGTGAQADEPALFTSDGCSLFPDASFIGDSDWCSCCYIHDISYWMGGTAEQRLAEDAALKACVIEKTASKTLAFLMYQGVRVGGTPYLNTSFRWGYGWEYARKYQPLTALEQSQVDALIAEDPPSVAICN
ncbi:MAG TPA: hypothetical protein DCY55_13565 [Gammaproteobacteria bacterium]|nr:hypothetical protein [Pseudomonadota bacterium]HAY47292.1 hypothetical protein [Gammaproteobacteria bacterium]